MTPLPSRPLLLSLLALVLVGCSSRPAPAPQPNVRTLAFASISPAGAGDLSPGLVGDLEDGLRRAFSARGYAVLPGPAADAQVRASWFAEVPAASTGRGEPQLGISVSVLDAKGNRIFSARSARTIPGRQWTHARVAAEADQLLRTLPPAPVP